MQINHKLQNEERKIARTCDKVVSLLKSVKCQRREVSLEKYNVSNCHEKV